MQNQTSGFAGSDWEFGRSDGSVIAPQLRLEVGGRIGSSPHPNESYWVVRNGNLCFLDADKELTTEFTEADADENGRRSLRGAFADPDSAVVHVLHQLPDVPKARIPSPAPRVALLVRTHLMNPKVDDLLRLLSQNECFDLFVCADCTNAELDFPGATVLRHRVSDVERYGFPSNTGNLLWYCGDYALYFSYFEIPTYDYYFMIEYDVDFVDGTPLTLEGIINRLGFGRQDAMDFVSCRSSTGTLDEGWGATVKGFYDEAHLCLFPFVVMSRPAVEYLIAERRAERRAEVPREVPMFCEAFVPSALHAGGFRRTDINGLLPGCTDAWTFRVPGAENLGPMLLGQHGRFAPRIKVIHPVYDEKNFVNYHVHFATVGRNTELIESILNGESALSFSAESLQEFRQCVEDLSKTAEDA